MIPAAKESHTAGIALGGLRVHTDICVPYFLHYCTTAQRRCWLPRLATGEVVTRAYADARVARIYAGSSEVMKVIIARELGLS